MKREKSSFIPYFSSWKMDSRGNIRVDPTEVHNDPEYQELLRKVREHIYGTNQRISKNIEK